MSLGAGAGGRRRPLPEVVGGAGWLLPPGQVDDWSEAMVRMLADGDERRAWARRAGPGRRYTWAATAEATVTSYRDVARPSSAGAESPGPDPGGRDRSGPDGRAGHRRHGPPTTTESPREAARAVPPLRPDTAPTGEVMTSIATELVARGHELHVVTSLPWYEHHRIEPGWEGPGGPPRGHRLGPHHPRPPVPHRQAQHPGPGGRLRRLHRAVHRPGAAGPARRPARTRCWPCPRRSRWAAPAGWRPGAGGCRSCSTSRTSSPTWPSSWAPSPTPRSSAWRRGWSAGPTGTRTP